MQSDRNSLRRLERLTPALLSPPQMSGMMCLTLVKLGDRSAFRKWARTARRAAVEAGDPPTISWVEAQEAYGHYYNGDLREAVAIAQHAQDIVSGSSSVGTVLAAARAIQAQERALALCPREDYTDWVMTRLDRAACLIYDSCDGDPGEGAAYAASTLQGLTGNQRKGIITFRGHEILGALTVAQRATPGARDLYEMLMATTNTKETPDP